MSVFLVEILSSYDGDARSNRDLNTHLPQSLSSTGQRSQLGGLAWRPDSRARAPGHTSVCFSSSFHTWRTPLCKALPHSLHFYLRMLENIFSYGIQVRSVLDVADVVSHGLDHHVTWRQDQLVGPDLRKQAQMSTV